MLEFEIQPIEIDVPSALAAKEEVVSICHEYGMGIAMREVAMYRVWRSWMSNSYLDVYSDDPNAPPNAKEFPTFQSFIQFLTRNLDVSRSKIYSRLKSFSLLDHLRYTDRDKLGMMASKPTLYEKALNAIFVFDAEARQPTAMKTNVFGDDPYSEDTITAVRDFLADLDGADSINDAMRMLMEDILGKPTVRLRMEGESLVLYYARNDVDNETGVEVVGDAGEVSFEPSGDIPDWVVEELEKKFPRR